MKTRPVVTGALTATLIVIAGCSKSEPREPAPEQPDAGVDAAASRADALRHAVPKNTTPAPAPGLPYTSSVISDSSGLRAHADPMRGDSMKLAE
jgi:hypothetical protein